MSELLGKFVEVGSGETVYYGKLVEINDNEVYLETESGWVVIPVDKVAFLREAEEEEWTAPELTLDGGGYPSDEKES